MAFFERRRRTHATPINKLIALANILMMILITTHIAIIARMALAPFFTDAPDAATAIINANSSADSTNPAREALWLVQMCLSSFLMTYRLWIVWRRDWHIVALPICGLITTAVCGSLFLNAIMNTRKLIDADRKNGTTSVTSAGGGKFFIIEASCDLFVNIYCTTLLSYKIWQTQKFTKQATSHLRAISPTNIIMIFVESAALYTLCILALLIAYTQGTIASRASPATYIVLDLSVPLTGIAYALVIVRFGMGGAFRNGPQLPSFHMPCSRDSASGRNGCSIALRPITRVNLEQHVETDAALDRSSVELDAKNSSSGRT